MRTAYGEAPRARAAMKESFSAALPQPAPCAWPDVATSSARRPTSYELQTRVRRGIALHPRSPSLLRAVKRPMAAAAPGAVIQRELQELLE
eukprot:scaffold153176_cov33-Tisochrysis_lutea.AAC.1